ncbi:MAG: RibD family protein [Candidatus Hodarchaeales archaeon]|jgi:riboflavin-specific deaminase-like protein
MVSNRIFEHRPKIILSAAISLDGQIASSTGEVKLSNTEDWKRVHHLRSKSDAIMVGSGTILADDSKLTIRPDYIEKGNHVRDPVRIVVSSSGKIPLDASVILFRPEIPTIIATTSKCPNVQREKFREMGCDVIICGDGPLVNLRHLMLTLYKDFNIHRVLLEGGSKLNGNMLMEKLIDEVHVSIAPVLGGNGIPFFGLPSAINSFDQSPYFEILDHTIIGDMIWLHLRVQYDSRILC